MGSIGVNIGLKWIILDWIGLLNYIELDWIELDWIELHCIALHCIALHCIALHCIAIGWNGMEWNMEWNGKLGWIKLDVVQFDWIESDWCWFYFTDCMQHSKLSMDVPVLLFCVFATVGFSFSLYIIFMQMEFWGQPLLVRVWLLSVEQFLLWQGQPLWLESWLKRSKMEDRMNWIFID